MGRGGGGGGGGGRTLSTTSRLGRIEVRRD